MTSERLQIIVLWGACLMLLGMVYVQIKSRPPDIIPLTELCAQGKPRKAKPARTYVADYDSPQSIAAANATLRAMARKVRRDRERERKRFAIW